MSKFAELKQLIASLEDDATKSYEKGNSAASTRLRTGLQKVKQLAQDARVEVLALKKG